MKTQPNTIKESPVTVGQLRKWLWGKKKDGIVGIMTLDGKIRVLTSKAYFEQEEADYSVVLMSNIYGN